MTREDAIAQARADAALHGHGFLRVNADWSLERLPPEEMQAAAILVRLLRSIDAAPVPE